MTTINDYQRTRRIEIHLAELVNGNTCRITDTVFHVVRRWSDGRCRPASKYAPGQTGIGIPDPIVSAISDVNGLVEFPGIPQGSSYRVRIGSAGDATQRWFSGVAGTGATTNMTSTFGIGTG